MKMDTVVCLGKDQTPVHDYLTPENGLFEHVRNAGLDAQSVIMYARLVLLVWILVQNASTPKATHQRMKLDRCYTV